VDVKGNVVRAGLPSSAGKLCRSHLELWKLRRWRYLV